jgi:hypothetical protein
MVGVSYGISLVQKASFPTVFVAWIIHDPKGTVNFTRERY